MWGKKGTLTHAAIAVGSDAAEVTDTMHQFSLNRVSRKHATVAELQLIQDLLLSESLQAAYALQVSVYLAIVQQVSLRTCSVMQTSYDKLDEASLWHDKAPLTLASIKFSKTALNEGKGREHKNGLTSYLTCTLKQDANKSVKAKKWNFDHMVTPDHEDLVRSSPHAILRGLVPRGAFAASHARNPEKTLAYCEDVMGQIIMEA